MVFNGFNIREMDKYISQNAKTGHLLMTVLAFFIGTCLIMTCKNHKDDEGINSRSLFTNN